MLRCRIHSLTVYVLEWCIIETVQQILMNVLVMMRCINCLEGYLQCSMSSSASMGKFREAR